MSMAMFGYVPPSRCVKQVQLIDDINFAVPDEISRSRLSRTLALLAGQHGRLGANSILALLPGLPLLLIAKKVMAQTLNEDQFEKRLSHQAFLGRV
jgi:hypothetical protein